MTEACFTVQDDRLLLKVKVIPGASRTVIGGIENGRLKIRVAAQPEDNKANEELRAFLAKTLDLAKKNVLIVSGEKSRLKTLSLPPLNKAALESLGFCES